MNFLSCVGVDIMGPKFKLIFVWPNLATQPKEHRVWTHGEGIRSSLFLSENIFFFVSSHLRHFFPECAWGAHSLSAAFFLGGDRSAYGILCVCVCVFLFICTGFGAATADCTQHILLHLCEGGSDCGWGGWVHTCICLLLFMACSIFCIT